MNKTIVALSTLALLFAVSCGGGKKGGDVDLSKYQEICAKVVKCDPSFAQVPDPMNNCQRLLGGVEQKLPHVVPQLTDCLKQAPCENLSFQVCGAKHMQEVKGLVP